MDKALEAAVQATRHHSFNALTMDEHRDIVREAITAYLSALPATDTSGLVERLRLIGYEATDEAADRIEALERENAGLEEACDETLAVAVRNKDRAEKAEADRDRLAAENESLRADAERIRSDREYVIGWNDGYEHAGGAPAKLQFPTMIRKMWSGQEVQKWIDDALAGIRSRAALSGGKDGE